MIRLLNIFILCLWIGIELKCYQCHPRIHGRYTRDIDQYQLAIPHKLTNHGKFLSFSLPHFFKHNTRSRRKRSADDSVRYGISIDGKYHNLELWPNDHLLSPHAFSEHRRDFGDPDNRNIKFLKNSKVCHYIGKIKGIPNSRVALSTCDGLAGYIIMNGQNFFIEPLQYHDPNKKGHHMHIIHKRAVMDTTTQGSFCGTSDDWVKSWKKRFTNFNRTSKFTKKSTHRYLELLVVCDKFFMDTHRFIDIQNYVLTIFNMVYDLYHDVTVGNMIDVSVVRIIYFDKEEEEIDIEITPEAVSTLARFCEWQQTINPKDILSPIHHDIAVLVTRYDICDETKPSEGCILLGLAYVGTPCTKEKPCCINEESGLSVGFTITHEIGHILGCSHDNFEVSGCNRQAPDGSYYVMSDTASDNITSWSSCSKDYITSLFEQGLGECLNDEPEETSYNYPHLLPGVVFDGDMQCNWLQNGAKLCSIANEEICEGLMCNPVNSTKCFYFSKPAMPGTKCAENKWCYKTKCIDKGKRVDAIHGGWGDWGDWKDCSRTCGGGVAFRERECNNPVPEHGGRFCLGDRKELKLCNTQGCPKSVLDFRAIQCKKFNNKSIMNKMSKWGPYILSDQPCVLYCMNERHEYAKLQSRVKDGTKCKIGTKDTCISGVCMKIGCDFEIGSDAQEDDCGVCKGHGNTCTIIEGTYYEIGRGYTSVIEIPKGAVRVVVNELEASDNTIALSDKDGEFCLNKDSQEFDDGIYDCFNASVVYTHPEKDKEMLTIKGPLPKALVLYVVFYNKKENVGYHYKYGDLTIPHPDYKPQYSWEHLDFGPCSYRCEGGTQTSVASCVEAKMGKMTPEFCVGIEQPSSVTRSCNNKPCKIKWRAGTWGPCKACKGAAGVKLREVECVKESKQEGGDDIIVEESKCTDLRPPSRDYCYSKRACGKKRAESDFPPEMMKELFYQTVLDMLDVDDELKDYFVSQARTIRALRRHLRKHTQRRSIIDQLCVAMDTSNSTSTEGEADESAKSDEISGNSTSKSSKGKESKELCEKKTSNKTKIDIGSTIMDDKHPESLKVIEIHSGGMAPVMNLSEENFQVEGNLLENNIIFDAKKNYTGQQALKCILNLQKVANGTNNP